MEQKSFLRRVFSSSNVATDDYANRKVPENWTWGVGGVIFALSGLTTAGFYFAYSPALVHAFGFKNWVIGTIYTIIVQTILGYITVKVASKTRLGTDLATRGLGFGYLGSLATALVWFLMWIYYYSLETQIIASALASYLNMPVGVWYIICGILFIPLTLYGMVFATKFQSWSIPIAIVWLIYVMYKIVNQFASTTASVDPFSWSTYWNDGRPITLLALLGTIAVFNGGIALNAMTFMEYARLLKLSEKKEKAFWQNLAVNFIPVNLCSWGLICSIAVVLYKVSGSLNPGEFFVSVAGVFGLIGLVVTQTRINIINGYMSSLMLSNIATRVFHFTPGRAFWAVITCGVGTLLCFGNMLAIFASMQVYLGIFLFAWIAILLSDFTIVRGVLKLDIGPIEHRRAYLKMVNPVGILSLLCGVIVAVILLKSGGPNAGAVMQILSSLAGFIGFIVSFVVHPIIVTLFCKNNKWIYIQRKAETPPSSVIEAEGTVQCSVCSVHADRDDVCRCPVQNFEWICSECCSNNSECGVKCQDPATVFPAL